jgi:hypothetical protein
MVQHAVKDTLSLLAETIGLLSDEEFSQPISVLSGATIGQHVRHVVELYSCLEQGRETGEVCYDSRKRERELEISTKSAINRISVLLSSIGADDIPLVLKADFGSIDGNFSSIATNYVRELAYNLDHTIHHMALIRIGVLTVSDIELDGSFGVAPSTLRFKQQVANTSIKS